jgi:hypothetical protein
LQLHCEWEDSPGMVALTLNVYHFLLFAVILLFSRERISAYWIFSLFFLVFLFFITPV